MVKKITPPSFVVNSIHLGISRLNWNTTSNLGIDLPTNCPHNRHNSRDVILKLKKSIEYHISSYMDDSILRGEYFILFFH